MTNFQDIPVEILLKIMTFVDRKTLLIASSVCRLWNTLIHEISWQFLCNSINSNQDSDMIQQLEFYGWEKEEHDVDNCRYLFHLYLPILFTQIFRCISIYLDNYPFTNPPNLDIFNYRCNEVIQMNYYTINCNLTLIRLKVYNLQLPLHPTLSSWLKQF